MSNLIKTLNKIHDSKVLELKSEKLELGAKSIEKSAKQLKSFFDSTLSRIGDERRLVQEKLEKLTKDSKSALKKYEGLKKDFKVSEAQLIDQAKELGINYQEVPAWKEARKIVNYIDSYAKDEYLK